MIPEVAEFAAGLVSGYVLGYGIREATQHVERWFIDRRQTRGIPG